MTSYTVTSHRLVGRTLGDVVTDADLEGLNVPALIAGGHLTVAEPEPEPKPRRKSASTESEAD